MTREAFRAAIRRLGLVATSTGYALAVAAIAWYASWLLALAALAGGAVVAVATTIEEKPTEPEPPAQPELTRRQIEARREAAARDSFDAE